MIFLRLNTFINRSDTSFFDKVGFLDSSASSHTFDVVVVVNSLLKRDYVKGGTMSVTCPLNSLLPPSDTNPVR